MFDRIIGAFTHKLWRVRESVLVCLQKTLNQWVLPYNCNQVYVNPLRLPNRNAPFCIKNRPPLHVPSIFLLLNRLSKICMIPSRQRCQKYIYILQSDLFWKSWNWKWLKLQPEEDLGKHARRVSFCSCKKQHSCEVNLKYQDFQAMKFLYS